MPNKPREGTSVRTLRIDDDLWAAARERAASEGQDMSAVIRELLRRYVEGR